MKNFPGVDFFYFSSFGWKVLGSISENIRKYNKFFQSGIFEEK